MKSNIEDVLSNLEHYRALQIKEVFVEECGPGLPWDKATVKAGGVWRSGCEISSWFTAEIAPGLTVKWSVDWEPYSASGAPTMQFNTAKIKGIYALLSAEGKASLREQFAKAIDEADKRLAEARLWEIAVRAQRDSLEEIFREVPGQ